MIVVRKILQDRPVECMMMRHLHRVKLIQFVETMISGTILIKASQEMLGIIKHSTTLFRGIMASKREMMDAWTLRDSVDKSSLAHFESTTTPFKIMNVLIWNCRGAMKPQFRKMVMDLVNWHMPLIMVITETTMSGARADEIIESLPFDGVAVADMIGFAGGIWLLWRSDLVQVDVLASTEQEIHALIQVRSQNFSWIISTIYASPRFVKRCLLWDNLTMLASLHNLP